jgi:hypothetical protein
MNRLALTLLAALLFSGAAIAQLPQNPNVAISLLPSAARTAATVVTADQINPQWNRAHVIINVSAYTSGTYTATIQGKDPVSGVYYTVLTGPAISATGITVLKVGPGFAPLPNAGAGDMLPQTWRVSLAGASTPSMTFSVSAFLEGVR